MSKQKTLKGSFSICGKGLHTGLSLTVTFNPAHHRTAVIRYSASTSKASLSSRL